MKNKPFLTLALSLLALSACGGKPTPSSSPASSPAATSSAQSSVAPSSSQAPSSSSEEAQTSYPVVSSESYVPPVGPDNPEEYDYDALRVNRPENGLGEDFAFGADLSSVAEVEANGGVYYNENGKAEDVFTILARGGVNYCRLRLWNEPYSHKAVDGEGNPLPYGGGTNDLETDIKLARRAKAAGMKVMIDFHYSDHWADPAKYWAPKFIEEEELFTDEVYEALGDWTRDALNAFKANGVTVDAVQIGNETNTGIAGYTNKAQMAEIVARGVEGAKKAFPNIKTLVHLANIKNIPNLRNFLSAVQDRGVDYDVVGLSFYPYYHGNQNDLKNAMDFVWNTYHKPTMVVETSYGFTNVATEYASNTYSYQNEYPGGYLTSTQGQASLIGDCVETLANHVDAAGNHLGQGVFWWEPAWLPVEGSTWATAAGQFYNRYQQDGELLRVEEDGTTVFKHPWIRGGEVKYTARSCYSAWANQAWFSYTGKALPSAFTYAHIAKGDAGATEKVVGARDKAFEVTVDLNTTPTSALPSALPATGKVVTNLDALRSRPIAWNQEDIAAIVEDGIYEVRGKLDGTYDVTCKVIAESNFIKDYSFENQGTKEEEFELKAPWEGESGADRTIGTYAKNEGNLDGSRYFHWYGTVDFDFTLKQKLTGIPAGNYDFSTRIMAGPGKVTYNSFVLWYQIEGQERIEVDVLGSAVKGWTPGDLSETMGRVAIDNIDIAESNTVITVGMDVSCKAESWGHSDLWSFALHKEQQKEVEPVSEGGLKEGLFLSQEAYAAPKSPWVTTVNDFSADQFKVAPAEDQKADDRLGDYTRQLMWWGGDVSGDTPATAGAFAFHQNVSGLGEGTYTFSFAMVSGPASGYERFNVVYWSEGDETPKTVDLLSTITGWTAEPKLHQAEVEVEEGKVFSIGLDVILKEGGWGRLADLQLNQGGIPTPTPTPEPEPGEEKVVTALTNPNFSANAAWNSDENPWILTENGANGTYDNQSPMAHEEGVNTCFNFWQASGTPLSFDLHQNVSGLEAGTYVLRFNLLAGKDVWQYSKLEVYGKNGDADPTIVDIKNGTYIKYSWDSSKTEEEIARECTATVEVEFTVEADKVFTFGVTCASVSDSWANVWGRISDFGLTKKA